jgi:hypothetical protein
MQNKPNVAPLIPVPFQRELDLVSAFNTFLRCTGLPSNTHLVFEFESGHGIADLVMFNTHKSFKQQTDNFANIPPRYAVIFGRGLLPKRFSAELFGELAGTGIGASVRILNQLVKHGVLKRVENKVYENYGKLVCPIDSIVSVEAKLSNWYSALRQAYRYREFSNQSWVLLDATRVSPALKQIQKFIRSGVGLASISTGGALIIYYEPPVTDPFSESRYWAACVYLARRSLAVL